jgi:hypothetical protein
MMHHVPQAGLTTLAVADPVERGVRRHLASLTLAATMRWNSFRIETALVP